jgi:hypothetical protein
MTQQTTKGAMLHACGLLIYCINERVDSEGMPFVRLAFLKAQ